MNHTVAILTPTPSMSDVPVSMRAADYLMNRHGSGAISEAVRHGMNAKRRGDDDAAEFWCSVCSTLVRMQQVGEPLLA